jgi:hypothetical protein
MIGTVKQACRSASPTVHSIFIVGVVGSFAGFGKSEIEIFEKGQTSDQIPIELIVVAYIDAVDHLPAFVSFDPEFSVLLVFHRRLFELLFAIGAKSEQEV